MKPILCPCCNRKFAKQETLLRHLNTAHRSKPGGGTATVEAAIVSASEISPNFNIPQGDDKQATVSVVTTTDGGASEVISDNNDNAVVVVGTTQTKANSTSSAEPVNLLHTPKCKTESKTMMVDTFINQTLATQAPGEPVAAIAKIIS